MAKRENNYSRTSERSDYEKTINLEENLDYLEIQGKLKPKTKLRPSLTNERCVKYYNDIVIIIEQIKNEESKEKIEELKKLKKEYQTSLINLLSIVIGSVIKKFKTLYPMYYQELFTSCTIDILSKINNNKYNPEKSALHSYVYETSYQAIIKQLNDKAQYENRTIDLLQD